ncbi:DUF1398 domain-containing protein [Deminuibacter soli]|uniref:DUF1398 domain-containing protein n=2 Tax=Deminuibacter soli TaxID=2291815 RepID=A0A3E1NIX9_9BACT|nr:DUF1398 domain-containing protein [Deminuibacter soli]
MFTVQQIKAAHAQVQSGADFPNYIREIKEMGVTGFETWVVDSHTSYFGKNNYQTQSTPMYEDLAIAGKADKTAFAGYLNIHQQGKTDYLTFCRHCAETGVEKWIVDLTAMTCTYYDKAGNELLQEQIPG